tara:strand:- start:4458 stop:4583 length:126 start_codon:yes stop_codon:yes gene_type:complete
VFFKKNNEIYIFIFKLFIDNFFVTSLLADFSVFPFAKKLSY